MKIVTLKIDERVSEKFIWLLEHFSPDEIKILEQSEYIDDDTYLRTIKGMTQSILEAKNEPTKNGVTLDQLEW
ncbi:hypothetical protein HUK38_13630 [Thiospirillum jenense]|uniref:Uncharacterized protein n=2 Tax=Thiospirillum jenense TaxID=1653858 RepID=A0A839HEE5_9GAMM|nr:hypothetical protein [Thiospirillum jenense]